MAIEINEKELKEFIENSNKPIVIDFYATWCGPCKVSEPVFKEFSDINSDRLEFYKVDVDKNREISIEYGIKSIPTFIVLENGKVKKKIVGVATREKLEDLISEYKLN
jgi:thioredoxin 1